MTEEDEDEKLYSFYSLKPIYLQVLTRLLHFYSTNEPLVLSKLVWYSDSTISSNIHSDYITLPDLQTSIWVIPQNMPEKSLNLE